MTSKKVVLKSSDGESFEVDEAVARQSLTVAEMLEDGFCMDTEVPLSDVTSKTLAKVIQYCKKHVEAAVDEELKAWDAEFMRMDESMLSDLVEAADENSLNIPNLYLLLLETLSAMNIVDVIGAIFSKSDFTPEEKENIRTMLRTEYDIVDHLTPEEIDMLRRDSSTGF